jgi:hypothetical protein
LRNVANVDPMGSSPIIRSITALPSDTESGLLNPHLPVRIRPRLPNDTEAGRTVQDLLSLRARVRISPSVPTSARLAQRLQAAALNPHSQGSNPWARTNFLCPPGAMADAPHSKRGCSRFESEGGYQQARVVKKQTRSVENAVAERPCWCKSSRGHHSCLDS